MTARLQDALPGADLDAPRASAAVTSTMNWR